MLASDPDAVAAVMITGTPPIALGPMGMLRGFHSDPALMLTTKGRFSARDIERFSRACYGEHTDPMLAEMLARTDERMRPTLFRSILMGRGADELRAVETATVPVAVVNGANEPFARLGYVERLAYATLWGGECQVVPGAGHAPFWETPELFNPIFGRFLAEVEAGRFAEPVEHRHARRA
jgi:pimeloyl-ACP methyl ester carboxylesterase